MTRSIFQIFVMMTFVSCSTGTETTNNAYKWPENVAPPKAEIQPHIRVVHGDSVADNYYWMIDYFRKGKDSTKVVDYLVAENNYLDTMMSGTKAMQEDLYKEMKARIKEKDESVPVFKNGYFYYTRTDDG